MHEQQTIEEKAIQTYQNNLQFFKETDEALFHKISSFELALEKGYYKEKYLLDYKEEGYFDVLEKETQTYLYGSNSKEYAHNVAKNIDFKKTDNLFESFYDVYINDKNTKTYDKASIPETQYSASARIINYSNNYADKTTTMRKIYKFIFFGTGLGLHLTAIDKKIQANVYFIVEDDLELFRLSLFVTNYKNLTKHGAKLYFSILDDDEEFKHNASRFFHEMFIYNHYIKFFHALNSNEKKIKEFQKIILAQSYLVFNYSALTTGMIRPLIHIKEKYNILNIYTPFKNKFINEKPFLLLGAGPTIAQNLQWIKQHQEKFIIVAVSALLSVLEEHNIKPSIITHVHGFDDALPHVQKVKNISFFDESICLFSTFSTPKFLSYFKKENIFLFQGTSEFKKEFSSFSSSNVGALMYGLILRLGADKLYLLGLDFAVDATTGATHTSSHNYVKKLDVEKTEYETEEDITYKTSVIEVKGNLQESVKTTIMFNGFKKQANAFSDMFMRETTKVYNLSDQGAYIDNTIPLSLKSFDLTSCEQLNKTNIYLSIKQTFQEKSENYLTKKDLHYLKDQLKYVENLEDILTKYKKRKYNNLDTFHYNLLGLFQDILSEEANENAQEVDGIISLYLEYISGYIFDIINTKELINEKHHIKELNKIVIEQISKVILFYKDFLSNYLKEIKSIEEVSSHSAEQHLLDS
jgi:hypothetical protein